MSTALAPPAELAPTSQVFAELLTPESRAFVLVTDDDLQLAVDIINDVKHRMAALTALKQSVTKPLLAGIEQYRSFFRPAEKAGEDARTEWDGKIRIFHNSREMARRLAEKALQEAIIAQDAPKATAAIQAFQPAPQASGLVIQDAWDFEESNHSIVPTQFTVVDRKAVLAEVKRQVGEGVLNPAIPGIKVFKKQIIKGTG